MDTTVAPAHDCFGDGLCPRWPWTNTPNPLQHHNNKDNTTAASITTTNNTCAGGLVSHTESDAGETFTAAVRRIWERPALAGSLAKDLPRLARRVTIRTRNGSDILPPSSTQAGTMGPVQTWALIGRLATTLVRELEVHKLAEVEYGLREIASRVTSTTELEMVVPELILLLGEDGKALKALKMVDQGVVLLGVHHMKGGVTKGLLTKDVRSADGWQIVLDVFEYVQVYHKRREQSVDAFDGASNHFELDFEVRATFDRQMTALTAAGLRVQRLVCAPTMQPEMRVHLESRILGDLIIL